MPSERETPSWAAALAAVVVIALLLLLKGPVAGPADASTDELRILFIGNSLTYYNGGVDRHVTRFLREKYTGRRIRVEAHTRPSQTFEGHYNDRALRPRLTAGGWDFVVLQGASYEAATAETLPMFERYGAALIELVRHHGAEPVLFQTWAFRSSAESGRNIRAGYVRLADQTSAFVAPVGEAWRLAAAEGIAEQLYSDGRHPSRRGTYLAAAVFYAFLSGESPEHLKYRAGLPAEEAAALRRIAWSAWLERADCPLEVVPRRCDPVPVLIR